jgi:uncharacterized membrane protein
VKAQFHDNGRRKTKSAFLKTVEVKIVQFTVNAKQIILVLWTLISVIVAVVIALSLSSVYSMYYLPWQLLLGVFLGALLAMLLPVYLFIALWSWLSGRDHDP